MRKYRCLADETHNRFSPMNDRNTQALVFIGDIALNRYGEDISKNPHDEWEHYKCLECSLEYRTKMTRVFETASE